MKILFHACCAGCAIYVFETLEKKFAKVTGLFFNPNIHPYTEFKNRQDALKEYTDKYKKKVIFQTYNPQIFFHEINYKETTTERCPICWHLRLNRAANFAKEHGYDSFTTSLLISPYQEHCLVKTVGEDVSKRIGIPFYYEDFRVGFEKSLKILKQEKLYSQKYCGCIYSEKERHEKKGNKNLLKKPVERVRPL